MAEKFTVTVADVRLVLITEGLKLNNVSTGGIMSGLEVTSSVVLPPLDAMTEVGRKLKFPTES